MMSSSSRHEKNIHLSDAELNDLIDETLASREAERAHAHLASCAECEERYRTLRATILALRTAPSLTPRRTFQLSPAQAKLAEPKPGRFDRIAERLMPGLTAIRAATLVVALLLLSVTAIDVITHRGSGGEQAGPVLMQEPGSVQQAAPTPTVALGALGESAAPAAGDASAQRAEESAADTAESAEAQHSFAALPESSPSSSQMAPMPKAEASPSPMATPLASPPPSSAEPGRGGAHVSRWRIAELGLLLLLFWLAFSWIGRARIGTRPHEDDFDTQ